ncbi:STAS domain-containing protein [Roseibium sp.]|uniref:STAS domain-containing protein n=1 Tax=Roseibium sp. TaxID=1936156 RepID=UPI003D1381C2
MQGQVELPVILDLGTVHHLRERLATAIAEQNTVSIDASQVERIGTPAVQVLLAASRALAAEDRPLVIQKASEPFRSAFADLGLSEQYSKWSAS